MKVEIVEALNFPPEIIFANLTDIPHHVDWLDEPVELISIRDGPAKLGTTWEKNVGHLGKTLVTLNTCNVYEMNRKFGWKSKKPYPTQISLLLEPDPGFTKLIWTVESQGAGIVQLAEPVLINQRMRWSENPCSI